MLDQLVADGVVPAGVSPESYLDVVVSTPLLAVLHPFSLLSLSSLPPSLPPSLLPLQSLQLAIFLSSLCPSCCCRGYGVKPSDIEVILRYVSLIITTCTHKWMSAGFCTMLSGSSHCAGDQHTTALTHGEQRIWSTAAVMETDPGIREGGEPGKLVFQVCGEMG